LAVIGIDFTMEAQKIVELDLYEDVSARFPCFSVFFSPSSSSFSHRVQWIAA
jgi:hypothetical protein